MSTDRRPPEPPRTAVPEPPRTAVADLPSTLAASVLLLVGFLLPTLAVIGLVSLLRTAS